MLPWAICEMNGYVGSEPCFYLVHVELNKNGFLNQQRISFHSPSLADIFDH